MEYIVLFIMWGILAAHMYYLWEEYPPEKKERRSREVACKIFYSRNGEITLLKVLPNRKKAEEYWNLIRLELERQTGQKQRPIYVETSKEKGK